MPAAGSVLSTLSRVEEPVEPSTALPALSALFLDHPTVSNKWCLDFRVDVRAPSVLLGERDPPRCFITLLRFVPVCPRCVGVGYVCLLSPPSSTLTAPKRAGNEPWPMPSFFSVSPKVTHSLSLGCSQSLW